MLTLFFSIVVACFQINMPVDAVVLDKVAAKNAFNLINNIRHDPKKYASEFRFSSKLKINNTALKWNDTLAKVAEFKASEMAARDYFSHSTPEGYGINYFIKKSGYQLESEWTNKDSNNFFESIAAGVKDGYDLVKTMIIDAGTPDFGHRNHLLGIGKWDASLLDIGIGFARRDSGSKYKSYVSIVIAKHRW